MYNKKEKRMGSKVRSIETTNRILDERENNKNGRSYTIVLLIIVRTFYKNNCAKFSV
jgi:hypothetical protein